MRHALSQLIFALALAGASGAGADVTASAGLMPRGITVPEREANFIAIFDKAQKQYAAARSVAGRQGARIGMQIDLHAFLGLTHRAQDWVGVFRQSGISQDGNRSIEIEIAPGVLISTWASDYEEAQVRTMLRPFSPLSTVLKDLRIGDPVKFSALLIGSVISSDDEMVLHPRTIAQFDRLEKLDGAPPR